MTFDENEDDGFSKEEKEKGWVTTLIHQLVV